MRKNSLFFVGIFCLLLLHVPNVYAAHYPQDDTSKQTQQASPPKPSAEHQNPENLPREASQQESKPPASAKPVKPVQQTSKRGSKKDKNEQNAKAEKAKSPTDKEPANVGDSAAVVPSAHPPSPADTTASQTSTRENRGAKSSLQEISKLKHENDSLHKQLVTIAKETSKDGSFFRGAFILTSILLAIALIVIYTLMKKSKIRAIVTKHGQSASHTSNSPAMQAYSAPAQPTTTSGNRLKQPAQVPAPSSTNGKPYNPADSSWSVAAASVIGKSHISSNIPCQDAHVYTMIDKDWGVAITCDGAGSAKNSHIGSALVSTSVRDYLVQLLKNEKKLQSKKMMTASEWEQIAQKLYEHALQQLHSCATKNQYDINSLACTMIVMVFGPQGIYVTHVGDGRAAYCDQYGEWKSCITPHKGNEANETVFLTSASWKSNSTLIMSGVNVPESRVITEKPIGIALMSDGCEAHSFECSKMDPITNKWTDPNTPFKKFFEPAANNLRAMHKANVGEQVMNEAWEKFLSEGTDGFRNEPDDKTMILGVLN